MVQWYKYCAVIGEEEDTHCPKSTDFKPYRHNKPYMTHLVGAIIILFTENMIWWFCAASICFWKMCKIWWVHVFIIITTLDRAIFIIGLNCNVIQSPTSHNQNKAFFGMIPENMKACMLQIFRNDGHWSKIMT